jgi:Cytochrome c oxidase biogenesis protein Cmc1 like
MSQQPSASSIKDDGRDARLSFRNFAETQLRKEFKAAAMKQCDLQIGAFAGCIQQKGLWAPFQCREYQKDVNECMAIYNSEERFSVFKREHKDEIDKKPYVRGASGEK